MIQQRFDQLEVKAFDSALEMGRTASKYVVSNITKAIDLKGEARIILATGASQFAFLDSLRTATDILWERVTVFHLDEYLGMSDNHPASFRRYLRERILDYVRPGKMHFLEADARDIKKEINRYTSLLIEKPIDIACIGIGENGHIAFNDPPVADFNDPLLVKKVELDEACRNQQLGEGWFADLNEVPTHALTLTVPAIVRSEVISCVVPDERKVEAVRETLYGVISENCPATILRTHKEAVLWLDKDSAGGMRS